MNRRALLSFGIAIITGLTGTGSSARAADVVLTLSNTTIGGRYGEIGFSREDLEGLPWSSVVTGNEFIDGVSEFRGPLAHGVVSLIGHAGARRARLIAASDFFVEIEISELEKYGVILALERDGIALSPRDQGPIWLIYPTDDYPELQDSLYTDRLVWQLRTIELF